MQSTINLSKKRISCILSCLLISTMVIICFYFIDSNAYFSLYKMRESVFSRISTIPPTEHTYDGPKVDKPLINNVIIEKPSVGNLKDTLSTHTSPTVPTNTSSTVSTNTSSTVPTNTSATSKPSFSSPIFLKPEILSKLTLAELKARSRKIDFSSVKVSKIVHQSWKVSELPPRFTKWAKTWENCFPTWKYKLWTDKDNDLFVKTQFPWFYDRYNRLTASVQKADAVRYLYMFAQGGVYADLDDECLRPFPQLLENYPIVFGAMDGHWFQKGHIAHLQEGYVQNSFMYSVAGHPLWLDVIETIMARQPSPSAESTTGPFMLQEVIGKWRKNYESRRNEIKIYPPQYFNPFSWINRRYPECKDVNRMTSEDIRKCKAHYPNSYVIQYHTQTWGRGQGNTNRNDRR